MLFAMLRFLQQDFWSSLFGDIQQSVFDKYCINIKIKEVSYIPDYIGQILKTLFRTNWKTNEIC